MSDPSGSAPRLSVCLPTWNGERDLERLLPRLSGQRVEGGFELVAIDSSSRDRSLELLDAAGARTESIPQAEFHHARTRGRLAELARGEVLVFLSQDALPEGERFLAELAAPFTDPRVAGVCARVLPHEDDDPLTARTALALPEAAAEPRVFEGPDAPAPFNDVASAIRANVLRELPFPEVAFGEDRAWADRALAAGWRLAFQPSALVRHAHRYSAGAAFRRYCTDARFHLERDGRRLRPGLLSVLRGIASECGADARFIARNRPAGALGALFRSPILRTAQVFGQYCGSRPTAT